MATVTESDLFSAVNTQFMTATETVNTTDYTAVGSPSFEGSNTSFPNSRAEKFVDLDGSTQYYTFNASTLFTDNQEGIISVWIKPDFNQSHANNRAVYITREANLYGVGLTFTAFIDDWNADVRGDTTFANALTTGYTWSSDDVLHMVHMFSNTGGLDSSYSSKLYINNVLVATNSTSVGTIAHSTAAGLGRYSTSAIQYFDGGIFDFAELDYGALASDYSDTEIVQALYNNSFGVAGAHKFVFELDNAPTAQRFLKPRARDRFLMFNVSERVN